MPTAIGIDLGTAQTSVAVYINGEIHIVPNDLGKKYTPSYVSFTDNEILIGEHAESQSIENPKNTVFGVKRFIGRRYDDPFLKEDMKMFPYSIVNYNGNPKICVTYKKEKKMFDPEEISALIIHEMKRNAEIMLGHQIMDAVITVPAFFNDSQRQATKDAGSIAGLNVLRILNEPTAAALAFGIDKTIKDEKKILVYDFGEGTFDSSVLNIKQGSIFEVLSTVGDAHLGGIEINIIMVNYISKLFFKECGKNITEDIQAVRRLTLACERAKTTLSREKEAGIFVGSIIDSKDLALSITREKFEELCEPVFNRTIQLVERALHESGFNTSEIDDVILVGGFTNMPKVQSLVRTYFKEKNISRSVNPIEAVTYGAAIEAAIIHGFKDKRIKDMMYVDVTPLSVGIEIAGGMMKTIIKRGTSIPCKRTYCVTTHSDKQPKMTIQVFEGERVLTTDNHLLGKLEIDDLPPVPRGVPRIEVTFEIDSDGILTVSAEEKDSVKSKSLSMKFEKNRLSPEEIDNALKDALQFEKQDQEERDKIRHRKALQNYVYSINKVAVSRQQSRISDRDKLEIQKICNETYDWLDTNPSTDKNSLVEKRKIMIKQLQPYASRLNLSAITDDDVDSIDFCSTKEETSD